MERGLISIPVNTLAQTLLKNGFDSIVFVGRSSHTVYLATSREAHSSQAMFLLCFICGSAECGNNIPVS